MARSAGRAGILMVAAVAIVACAKKNETAQDTSSIAKALAGETVASSTSAAPGGWSDANIFAVLDEANAADSAEGAIAATKGTSAQVREFGKLMMRDHHAMRLEVEALAKKLGIVPQPAPDDRTQAEFQKSTEMLNATTKGRDFDRAYIDLQVEDHKSVLEKAIRAMASTQTAELKNLLQKAAPRVEGHLDRAEAIQKTMK